MPCPRRLLALTLGRGGNRFRGEKGMRERYWFASVSWLVHALGMRRNPLRRRVDRVLAVSVLGLLVVAVAVVPMVALSTGRAEYAAQRHEAAMIASEEHVVDAVVVTEPVVGGAGPGEGARTHADVGWTGADGRPRAARAAVPATSHVGTRFPLWVDAGDHVAPIPPTEAASRASSAGTAFGVLVLGLLGCAALVKAVRVAADTWARRHWEQEWARVEPDWTRPGRGGR